MGLEPKREYIWKKARSCGGTPITEQCGMGKPKVLDLGLQREGEDTVAVPWRKGSTGNVLRTCTRGMGTEIPGLRIR